MANKKGYEKSADAKSEKCAFQVAVEQTDQRAYQSRTSLHMGAIRSLCYPAYGKRENAIVCGRYNNCEQVGFEVRYKKQR